MALICKWPDGSWCHAEDVADMDHMSDDYETVEMDLCEACGEPVPSGQLSEELLCRGCRSSDEYQRQKKADHRSLTT